MFKIDDSHNQFIHHGIVTENRRARYSYIVQRVVEAGLILSGSEVKSLRLGRCTITECYAAQKGSELYLLNAYIPEYQGGVNYYSSDTSRRPRKLLLHLKEIKQLCMAITKEGMTIIPLKVYFNSRGIAKILLGLSRGQKLFDRREEIRKRDWKREQARLIREKG